MSTTKTLNEDGSVSDAALEVRRAVAVVARLMSPHSGTCRRCNLPWTVTQEHTTRYGAKGCFPLCEKCWRELTPEERLPYYRQLADAWESGGHGVDWEAIERAVLYGG